MVHFVFKTRKDIQILSVIGIGNQISIPGTSSVIAALCLALYKDEAQTALFKDPVRTAQ
jgi:hypothetical protein